MIGAAGTSDTELLGRLAKHGYVLVASSAGRRLAELYGELALTMIMGRFDEAFEDDEIAASMVAARAAESVLYGLVVPD